MSESIRVPIKIHPRAFSAFGEDLITNENVAMIELVKNSYDAYALKVEIKFGYDQLGAPFISITDDGCGMTRDTIENAGGARLGLPMGCRSRSSYAEYTGNELRAICQLYV